jgi:hypothetical protein
VEGIITKTKPTVYMDMNTPKKIHTQDQTDQGNVANAGATVKTKWSCKSCGITVILGVAVTYPPTHICRKKAERIIPLQKEGHSNE